MVWLKKATVVLALVFLTVAVVGDIGVRAGWFKPTLRDVCGKTFINERVPLDGHAYRHYRFENVTFVVNGEGHGALEYNEIGAFTVTSDREEV